MITQPGYPNIVSSCIYIYISFIYLCLFDTICPSDRFIIAKKCSFIVADESITWGKSGCDKTELKQNKKKHLQRVLAFTAQLHVDQ